MNKRASTYCLQFLFVVAGLVAFGFSIQNLKGIQDRTLHFNIWTILGVFVLFCLLHFLKLVRYYFILSETPISITAFIPIYLETTLLNILLPFKIGELYRFYIIGKTIDNYSVSFLSILTERFFDTSVVAIILTAQIFLFKGSPDGIYLFFLIFVGTLFIAYKMYPKTYRYLNAYFVRKEDKPRDIVVLDYLRKSTHVYADEKALIKDRSALVFLLSFFSWIIEYFLLNYFSRMIGIQFNFQEFSYYIKSILSLSDSSNSLLNLIYIIISSVLLVVMLLICKFIFFNKRKEQME